METARNQEMAYVSVSGDGMEFELSDASKTTKGVAAGRKLFARYILERILGCGGMGVVWLARDQRLDRVVALKVLPDEVFYDVASREELKNETRKSLELTHSNIVRIHDFVEDEGSAAISMEYVDGATLSHLRLQAKNKVLEANVLGPWIREICEALHYAHQSAKLAHRDLKPANVMVNARDEVKITDFGIACSLRNSLSRVSIRQSSSGTLVYMSPEQMMGEAATPPDDIYALGATIYEMMTSKPPFYEGDIALQVCKVEASSMAERRLKLGIDGKEIPTAWEETIAKCLSKNPGKRPTSMMELAGTLGLLGQPVWKRQHLAKATSLLSGRAKDGFRALLKNRGACRDTGGRDRCRRSSGRPSLFKSNEFQVCSLHGAAAIPSSVTTRRADARLGTTVGREPATNSHRRPPVLG